MRALVFDRFGGLEVLQLRELPDPVPSPQQALIRTRAIGLNFAEVYRHRFDTAASLLLQGAQREIVRRRAPRQAQGEYRFALSIEPVAAAHAHLESRRALGKVLLIP